MKRNLWGWIAIIGFLVIGIGAGCGPRITLLTPTLEATPGLVSSAEAINTADAPVAISSSTPVASVDYRTATPGSGEARVAPLSAAVNIRRGPGTTYEIIGSIRAGETARVLFRDATSQWLNVMTDGGLVGWVAADLVVFVSGSVDQLMVATVEPAAPVAATAEPPPDEGAPEDEPPGRTPMPPTETPGLAITKVPPTPRP